MFLFFNVSSAKVQSGALAAAAQNEGCVGAAGQAEGARDRVAARLLNSRQSVLGLAETPGCYSEIAK